MYGVFSWVLKQRYSSRTCEGWTTFKCLSGWALFVNKDTKLSSGSARVSGFGSCKRVGMRFFGATQVYQDEPSSRARKHGVRRTVEAVTSLKGVPDGNKGSKQGTLRTAVKSARVVRLPFS
jgi:hypothetical protein